MTVLPVGNTVDVVPRPQEPLLVPIILHRTITVRVTISGARSPITDPPARRGAPVALCGIERLRLTVRPRRTLSPRRARFESGARPRFRDQQLGGGANRFQVAQTGIVVNPDQYVVSEVPAALCYALFGLRLTTRVLKPKCSPRDSHPSARAFARLGVRVRHRPPH
jgi:hypothetical protein